MTTVSTSALVLTMLASSVVVLTGLVVLTRAIWNAAQDIRDNKKATLANTAAVADLSQKMDGRISVLESRVAASETAIARLQPPAP